jgi:hypothetical protein
MIDAASGTDRATYERGELSLIVLLWKACSIVASAPAQQCTQSQGQSQFMAPTCAERSSLHYVHSNLPHPEIRGGRIRPKSAVGGQVAGPPIEPTKGKGETFRNVRFTTSAALGEVDWNVGVPQCTRVVRDAACRNDSVGTRGAGSHSPNLREKEGRTRGRAVGSLRSTEKCPDNQNTQRMKQAGCEQ